MWRRLLLLAALLLVGLTVPWAPASSPPPPEHGRSPFAWNRDEQWASLEARFLALRDAGCDGAEAELEEHLRHAGVLLENLEASAPPDDVAALGALEPVVFDAATHLAACPRDPGPALAWLARYRDAVKRHSRSWDLREEAPRARLYFALYGARAALEEALLQQPPREVPPLALGRQVPSVTPSLEVHGVRVHSGDLLVSRGGAPTSALIARGSDAPGNFSHVALLHVDEATGEANIVEAHIEVGVVVTPLDRYLADRKLRLLVLRARDDLPELRANPRLPHLAATAALARARREHVPYDFAMDAAEPSALFCSEVAWAAYASQGLTLWPGQSFISAPGTRRWLWSVGVRNFATLEPSDLEYDPQLAVVAEWFDAAALAQDHRDNAVTDVLLEAAEAGVDLDFDPWRRPLARVAKAWSALLVATGRVGPVPEGMSPEAALRSLRYSGWHEALSRRVDEKAEAFRRTHGYAAPYWQLVRLAREARDELGPASPPKAN
jgi:hypothetical protein